MSATKAYYDDSSSHTRATSIFLDKDGNYIVSGVLLESKSKIRRFALVKLQPLNSLKTSWRKTLELKIGDAQYFPVEFTNENTYTFYIAQEDSKENNLLFMYIKHKTVKGGGIDSPNNYNSRSAFYI